jgi:hypothetical protein
MMQRIGTKNLMNVLKATRKVTPSFAGCRFMSGANNNLTIKSNMEQLSGIRLQELQAEAEGKVINFVSSVPWHSDDSFLGCL